MERPTIKRKEREREARREAILDAAAYVFSQKTYYEATLDEIAARAELAKGTLYNYYRDKGDIFASLIDRGFRRFQQQLDEIIAARDCLRDLITGCFEVSLKVVRDHRYMYRLMLTAGEHLSERTQSNIIDQWHEQAYTAARKLADALVTIPETSTLPESERMTGAMLVMSAIHSLHHRQMMEPDEQPLRNDIENFVRLLCRALIVEKTA